MSRTKHLPIPPRTDRDALVEAWGAVIDDELLSLALTHRSYANEAGGIANNERLEFLGDAILSLVIADRLFHDHPDASESELSQMRAATVSQEPLAQAARKIDLGSFIYLGKGESASGGRDKDSILSDTFEAMIGATYETQGLEVTRRVVLHALEFLLVQAVSRGWHQDWKTIFAERAAHMGLGEVSYEVHGEGPDHQRVFTAWACVSGRSEAIGTGSATSKKHAETAAARDAVRFLETQSADTDERA